MDPASPEDYVASDDESIGDESEVKQEQDQASPLGGPSGNGKSGAAGKTSAHHQKRRRVTRACDECRRKKIKCDGKQPCTHCTVYSYGKRLPGVCLLRLATDPCLQNARMTNLPTGDGTLRLSTWRISNIVSTEPSLYYTSSYRTSI